MAAYAALVSIMHIIDQLQLHPRPPISLDKKQVESLTEKVTFLQDFLERYSHVNSKEVDDLESRIADAAYAAEDVIESHIADQIHAGSTSNGQKISSIDFYRDLHRVIGDMDLIRKEAVEIKEIIEVNSAADKFIIKFVRCLNLRSASVSRGQNRTEMLGFDDVLYEIMDKLTRGQLSRLIIPIVGMGGIGKTTLTRNIYENQVVVQYFDILAWATVSQEYNRREILLQLTFCLKSNESRESLSHMSEEELGEKLYKKLFGWRYLIILDDIWNIEVWDELKIFFPDNNSGSRIMLSTRLSKLAFQLTGSYGLEMKFLNEDTSWNLLRKSVFGKEDCPFELEGIGRKIAKNCKGLPLSICVIGGVLSKSEHTPQYWEYINENLNSVVNLEDNERCFQILYMSYKQMPIHLKPCFLYMGVFREDSEIRVSRLIKLWVAEGFLRPISGKSLEEVAEEYLKELIHRNLILVHQYGYYGKIKYCKLHDLMRDLCIREAQKQKFLCVIGVHSFNNLAEDINTERRIFIPRSTAEDTYPPAQVLVALETASLARSLIWEFEEPPPSHGFRLLRVSSMGFTELPEAKSLKVYFQQVNLRYLNVQSAHISFSRSPSSVSLLWSLQTLVVHSNSNIGVIAPSEIWKMPQLRHVRINDLELPDPPSGKRDDHIVLENLQTLSSIKNFKLGEEAVKRIPNIKRLSIYYLKFEKGSGPIYYLNNLGHLHKLESLTLDLFPAYLSSNMLQNLSFPHSLKKLALIGTHFPWKELTTKIGSLPLLEVLKLDGYSCKGRHWETVEGQFRSLKLLLIDACKDLEYWTTESTHFPRLEHLHLRFLHCLKEIPLSIGDIPTLQTIQLEFCSDSAVESAKTIQREQEEFGNVDLKVQVDYEFV